MATSVSIYDAKTHLSKLVARAETGEEITLTRSGRPVARLVPLEQRPARRTPGSWRGRVRIHDDFDDFVSADEQDWYGA
ncbi:type II toxin-antitoxin system Phd/YefM family antitoxin [Cellulomonas hominis]|nr:antitoxin [Actinomycetota bacterium]